MNITILDDYQDAVRSLACFSRLAGHEVRIFHDTVKDEAALAARLAGAEAVVLIRERTRMPASQHRQPRCAGQALRRPRPRTTQGATAPAPPRPRASR